MYIYICIYIYPTLSLCSIHSKVASSLSIASSTGYLLSDGTSPPQPTPPLDRRILSGHHLISDRTVMRHLLPSICLPPTTSMLGLGQIVFKFEIF